MARGLVLSLPPAGIRIDGWDPCGGAGRREGGGEGGRRKKGREGEEKETMPVIDLLIHPTPPSLSPSLRVPLPFPSSLEVKVPGTACLYESSRGRARGLDDAGGG